MRFATGLRKPKNPVPGHGCRGHGRGGRQGRAADSSQATRSSVGPTERSPSTRRATEDQFVKKPANLTFEQAAAVGVSATTALQLLRDDGHVQPGQKVLDQRGVGRGGHVRRADRQGVRRRGDRRDQHQERRRWSARSAPTMSSTTPPRTSRRADQRYDLILDNVGNHSMAETRRALTPERDADLQRRRTRRRQARPDDQDRGRVHVRAPAGRAVIEDPERRRPAGPQGARRSREGHAGHRRHVPAGARRPRRSSTSPGPRPRDGRRRSGTVASARRALLHSADAGGTAA